ncbi:hypothetical protein CK203_006550 [Vitis vinifera]|uniref:Uncharacterized protein n=1 Tax=Vitis vinifera TaxID=29760 RepID=A0A438KBF6_VITVI|nr:hypothetical protein CK203_006550 [Vitis vinifera]
MHRIVQGRHILLVACLASFGQGSFWVILCFKALSSPLSIYRPFAFWDTAFKTVGMGNCPLTVGIAPCKFVSAPRSNMPAKKDTTSPSAAKPSGKGGRTVTGPRRPYPGKPTELLNE